MRRWPNVGVTVGALYLALSSAGGAQSPVTPVADSARPAARMPRSEWKGTYRAFVVSDENDAFAGGTDSSYTQGLRFAWDFAARPARLARFLEQASLLDRVSPTAHYFRADTVGERDACEGMSGARVRRDSPCSMIRLSVMQTMYTPPDLRSEVLNPHTRPYAGYLALSVASTLFAERRASTTELSVGILGPASGAEATQSLAHWTWSYDSPRPVGWRHQLRNAPQLSLRNLSATSLMSRCKRPGSRWYALLSRCPGAPLDRRVLDLVVNEEVIAGTLMNRASAGGSLRLGWNFPELGLTDRIGTTAPGTGRKSRGKRFRQSFWMAGYAGWDGRALASNSLLSGSYNDFGVDGWRTKSAITLRQLVSERYGGFAGGSGQLAVSWQRVRRSAEYAPGGGAHTFGSISVAFSARMSQ